MATRGVDASVVVRDERAARCPGPRAASMASGDRDTQKSHKRQADRGADDETIKASVHALGYGHEDAKEYYVRSSIYAGQTRLDRT